MVTQTVILAAGMGVRLSDADPGVPKPLMTVGGVPLIAHALAHAAASGCREAVVVVGHERARVKAAVEALHAPLAIAFVETPDPTAPNGLSLLSAEPVVQPHFYVQMVDHVFGAGVLPALTRAPLAAGEAGRVLVDRAPRDLDLDDATRVRLNGGRVTAIGKHIEPWHAIDAGCFVLTPAVFAALRAVGSAEALTVSSAMRQLVAQSALGFAELADVPWADVDTPVDRAAAERLLACRAGATVAGR
jgi:choline kinase